VAIADIDGDGDDDIAALSNVAKQLVWYSNDAGDGSTWTQRTIESSSRSADAFGLADIDRDGDVDAYMSQFNQDKVKIFLNDGTPLDGGWEVASFATAAAGSNPSPIMASDINRDGNVDLVVGSEFNDILRILPNHGGQFGLATSDISAGILIDGFQNDTLQIDVTHNGRAGDDDIELASLDLEFDSATGVPLSRAAAQALLDEVLVTDDTNAILASAGPVDVTGGGQLTTPFTDGDSRVAVAPGDTVSVTVGLIRTADADLQTPNTLRLTHVTESSSKAENAAFDTALRLERTPNVASQDITMDDGIDSDKDGLTDAAENIFGSDPNEVDSDGDGLEDGEEVFNYFTSPTDSDTDADGFGDGEEVAVGSNPLNDTSTPGVATWVDFAFGGVSDGSFLAPYSTLADGTVNTAKNGLVRIKGSANTSETPALSKALRYEAIGGKVTIGAP
jgi:hypothetical protein